MTTHLAPTPARNDRWAALRPANRWLWVAIPVLIAGLLYLSTYQTHINSSGHPFTTDVGEHQNALPRWGLIHHSGYPQWSALGSLFVSILGLFGVAPAAAVSLWSLLWGLITVALLVWLAFDLGVAGPFAALGALAAGLTTSMWVDSSVGELHTMTTAITVATLWLALRFGRSGSRGDLLWLTFIFSQGIFHQRSVLFLAPAVLLLAWPHLLTPFRMGWRTLLLVIGVALLAPLTYLYLPLRVWTGADWVFGSPGTWDGFWALFFFNNADHVVEVGQTLAAWIPRLRVVGDILNDDLALWLLIIGLGGLWLPPRRPTDTHHPSLRISLALTLVWFVNLVLTVLIWTAQVSDAQLAAKLPVLLMAGLGLSFLLQWLWKRSRPLAAAGAVALAVALIFHSGPARAFTLEITRDTSTQALVDMAGRLEPSPDGRPMTLISPWGTDYWTLTYAQGFDDKLQGIRLVDHNATPQEIVRRGDRLLALERTFFVFPLAFYEERLGPLYLATAAPGIVEMSPTPIITAEDLAADPSVRPADFDLGNGISILGTRATWSGPDEIVVTVYWGADETPTEGYSVAAHLVAADPPVGGADVLAQADRSDPVENWYPTTSWREGEIVRDAYLLTVPEGSAPAAIRLAMYRSDPEAGFINTPWLSIPIPEK